MLHQMRVIQRFSQLLYNIKVRTRHVITISNIQLDNCVIYQTALHFTLFMYQKTTLTFKISLFAVFELGIQAPEYSFQIFGQAKILSRKILQGRELIVWHRGILFDFTHSYSLSGRLAKANTVNSSINIWTIIKLPSLKYCKWKVQESVVC